METETKRAISIVPSPNNIPYVVAIIVMTGIAIVGVATITIFRPNQDNTVVIASIFGFLAPTTLSLLAFMKAQETHLSVNSRLDQFMKNAELAARSEGFKQGQQEANDRTDLLKGV